MEVDSQSQGSLEEWPSSPPSSSGRRKRTRGNRIEESKADLDKLFEFYFEQGDASGVKTAMRVFGLRDLSAVLRTIGGTEEGVDCLIAQPTTTCMREAVVDFMEDNARLSLAARERILKHEVNLIYENLKELESEAITLPDGDTYFAPGSLGFKLTKLLYFIPRAGRILRAIRDIEFEADPRTDPCFLYGGKKALRRCANSLDRSTMNNWQRVFDYLLDQLFKRGYRRCGEDCFEKVFNEKGQFTYSWKKACSIETFVYEQCKAQDAPEMWKRLTDKPENLRHVVEHLKNWQREVRWSDLVKDRTVFSFRNGVYLATENEFHIYDDAPLVPAPVAAKYFDIEFRPEWTDCDIADIPTPKYDKILEDQHFPEDVREWHWVMAGRLMYPIKSLDGWEIMPFHKGLAGTGKSTLIHFVYMGYYDPQDVGTISNNMEERFGLYPHCGKFLVAGLDIKANFSLPQATWQSMISGERVCLAVKHKNSVTLEWVAGCVWAGNEVPAFRDGQGGDSVGRRCLVFNYYTRVTNSDATLGERLRAEMPAIIAKANRIYQRMAEKHGDVGIWTKGVLPEYFHEARGSLQAETNSIVAFLRSDRVVFGPEHYVPVSVFKRAFYDFVRDSALDKPGWSDDLTRGPFQTQDPPITRARTTLPYRGRRRCGVYFFKGVDIVQAPTTSLPPVVSIPPPRPGLSSPQASTSDAPSGGMNRLSLALDD